MFVHLNVHSHYSFHRGTMSPEEIVRAAAEARMEAVALTDVDGMYAAIPFYKAAKEAGIRPLLGAEMTGPKDGRERCVLLAKNRAGYAEICRIVTERRLLSGEFDLAERLRIAHDIFILTSSEKLLGELASDGSPGDLFCAISVAGRDSRSGANRLYRAARRLGVPVAAVNDVYFRERGDFELHRVLRAIGTLSTISTIPEEELASPENYFKSQAEMAEVFKQLPEALYNARKIADECDVDLGLGAWHFPAYPLPQGESAESFLHREALAGFKRRYAEPTPKERNRLYYELKVINSLGFAPYFLVVYDIVRECARRNVPVIGRGSAAGSIVSYSLGITHVDPIKFNLLFERFLNPTRKSPPDIDIDLSWKLRDDIIEYVYERYGHDRTALISTTNRYAARSAFREAAKAYGLPGREISLITKRFPWGRADGLSDIAEKHAECRDFPVENPTYRTVLEFAHRMAEFPRHLSIHCGGIVISPSPITDYVPLERSAKGFVVTQPDMFPIEEIGLIKIDLLGNRSLGVLPDALDMVEETTGTRPDVSDYQVLFDDEDVQRMMKRGATMGCFYIESPAMRNLLQKLKVGDYEKLTAASSVIRPGVAHSGMMDEYVKRNADPRRTRYMHPVMRDLLSETYGIMIYQEDVIKVAHRLAGMSLAEADLLRRAMSGKMRSSDAMTGVKDKFIAACDGKGIARDIARKIWEQIESFAGYAFCKAHSASFALLSFQVAYLKAHYPAEFMACVITNGGGYYGPWAYISETKRLGIKVLSPDVNESSIEYTGREREMRIGLMAIKGLTYVTMGSIVAARQEKPYESIADFLERSGAGVEEALSLARVGGFDSLGITRPQAVYLIESSRADMARKKDESVAPSLYPEAPPLPEDALPDLAEYTPFAKARAELELLGYMVGFHPLELIELPPDVVDSRQMRENIGRRARMAGWLVSAKRLTCRGSGRPMKFMSMEDMTGTFEVTVFPDAYEKYAPITLGYGPYLFEGKIQDNVGLPTLECEKIEVLPFPALEEMRAELAAT